MSDRKVAKEHVFVDPHDTYPAKQMYSTQAELRNLVTHITLFPVDDPKQAATYRVS